MSSNMLNVLREASKFLAWLADRNTPAVIAGGFLRDYMNDKPIRDIDLYIRCDDFEALYKELREADPYYSYNQDTFMYFSQNTDEYDHQSIQVQTEFEGGEEFQRRFPDLKDYPINLIGLRNDKEVQAPVEGASITSCFNLGLSQVWISQGDRFIRYSKQFRTDFKLKQNTVMRSDWGHAGTVKAVHKFKSKYPDWTIVNPDGTLWDQRAFLREAGL